MYEIDDDTELLNYLYYAMEDASGLDDAQTLAIYPAALFTGFTDGSGAIV